MKKSLRIFSLYLCLVLLCSVFLLHFLTVSSVATVNAGTYALPDKLNEYSIVVGSVQQYQQIQSFFDPVWPVSGTYKYAYALDYYYAGKPHLGGQYGVDIHPDKWNNGSKDILAIEGGVILDPSIDTDSKTGWGKSIIIDHQNGYYSRYSHLANKSAVLIKGATVKKGQKIAEMGSTGNSTGIHLDLRIMKGNTSTQIDTFSLYLNNSSIRKFIKIDSASVIQESIYYNTIVNTYKFYKSGSEYISPELSDLIPTGIQFNNSDLAVDRQIFMDSGIRNTGSASSDSFTIKWYVNNAQEGYGVHDSVPANTTVFNGNSFFYWTPHSSGTYVIKFVIDADKRIAEINENNNEISVTVYIPPSGDSNALPDLIPTSILYNNNDLAVGRPIFIDSGIRNTGNVGSGSFIIHWYVNDVHTVYSGHSAVAANATVLDGNSGYNWTPPSTGTYIIKFVVDADNRIAESNENNNMISVTVYVPPTATEQNCDPNCCILYQDINFSGQGYSFSIGEYADPSPCGFPNDFFSSVRIGSNVKLIVYEHSFYGGEWEVFTSNDESFGDNRIGNDRISSVKVVTLNGETTESSVSRPGTPANLRQTNVSGNTVNLAWTSVSGAQNYQIFESVNNNDWWSVGHSDNPYCQVNGLSPNMSYYFKVCSHNSAGDSDYSTVISVRTNSN